MWVRIKGNLASTAAWLGLRPSYMLLTAAPEELARRPAEPFGRAWVGLMVLSVAWGIGAAMLWELCFWVFNWYSGLYLVPTAAVVAAYALWLYRRSIVATAELLAGPDAAGQAPVGAAIVVVLTLVLLGLKGMNEDWATYLPPAIRWARPRAMYRVLILAPAWGAWAMLITCQFCRPDPATAPAVAALRLRCGPLRTAGCLAALLVGTIWYFNYLPWTQLSISGIAIVSAVAGGGALCRRAGGLRRGALLATNMVTQLAFMLAYLANACR